MAVSTPSVKPESTPARSEPQRKVGAEEETAMQSVGLDWASKEVRFAVAQNGKIVERGTFRGLDGLARMLADRPRSRVAVEAGRQGWVIHDRITAAGHEACVMDTTRTRQAGIGQHGRKNDKLDADALALSLDGGRLPAAHVLSPERREIREALQVRAHLVEERAKTIVMVRGLVSAHGESIGSCDTDHFTAKLAGTSLTKATRKVIAPLVAMLARLDEQLAILEPRTAELVAKEPVARKLMSVPGVGPIVALQFISVIDDPKRFRNAHQVGSYLGLAPREDSSGGPDKQKLGHITKAGNGVLRALLVQAAWCSCSTRGHGDDPLASWVRTLKKRRGNKIAVVALARKLAGILWALWKRDQVYEPARLAGSMARGTESQAQSAELTADSLRRVEAKLKRRAAERRPQLPKEAATTT